MGFVRFFKLFIVFFNFLDTAGGRDRGQNEFMAVADSNFTIIADIKIGKQTSVIN